MKGAILPLRFFRFPPEAVRVRPYGGGWTWPAHRAPAEVAFIVPRRSPEFQRMLIIHAV
jgi:hypothetical protein